VVRIAERTSAPHVSERPLLITLGIIALGALVWAIMPSRDSPAREYLGGARGDSVVLEDGTGVRLSAGTVLRTTDRFGRGWRLVQLEGEALFDVAPARVNFNVETRAGLVSDIGARRFSIRNDARMIHIVVLDSGALRLQGAGQDTIRAGRDLLIPVRS